MTHPYRTSAEPILTVSRRVGFHLWVILALYAIVFCGGVLVGQGRCLAGHAAPLPTMCASSVRLQPNSQPALRDVPPVILAYPADPVYPAVPMLPQPQNSYWMQCDNGVEVVVRPSFQERDPTPMALCDLLVGLRDGGAR